MVSIEKWYKGIKWWSRTCWDATTASKWSHMERMYLGIPSQNQIKSNSFFSWDLSNLSHQRITFEVLWLGLGPCCFHVPLPPSPTAVHRCFTANILTYTLDIPSRCCEFHHVSCSFPSRCACHTLVCVCVCHMCSTGYILRHSTQKSIEMNRSFGWPVDDPWMWMTYTSRWWSTSINKQRHSKQHGLGGATLEVKQSLEHQHFWNGKPLKGGSFVLIGFVWVWVA